jgi:hypothetical protein
MRKLILAGAAVLALGVASPALADSAAVAAGGTIGATTGATAGFFLGGPIGAVIGGFTGAALGASVSDASVDYVDRHPVEPIYLEGSLDVGTRLGSDVTIYPIEGDAHNGYIYANGRAYIVDLGTRAIVQSPGYYVPRRAVEYARGHRVASVAVEGNVAPGFRVGADVKVRRVPHDSAYSYVYLNDRPALIDNRTNLVVWVGD